jgi:hypothetical protein
MKAKEPDLSDLIKSSIGTIENFEQSTLWEDIVRILDDWDNGLKENYRNAETMDEVRMYQGISQCIEYVKNLPMAMKAIVKMEVKK